MSERESEAAYRLLGELERTLAGGRRRLADLADLSGPGASTPLELTAPVPSADELCAPVVPAELVLPPEVDAPTVVVLPDAVQPADLREELSAR